MDPRSSSPATRPALRPTHSQVKRPVIYRRYADRFDRLYAK